jgi:phosphotriesterase-related protein
MANDEGKIVTVNGKISPDELGITLPHEHLFFGGEAWFEPPDSGPDQIIANEPITLENLWWIRENAHNHKDNARVASFETVLDEVWKYFEAGGETIVDVTPKNCGGDPTKVRAISRRAGMNIIHGTAYYVESGHPPEIAKKTIEELEAEFVDDIEQGIDDTDVRAGIVGEIGLSGRIHDDEEKVLRAASRAARKTGAPLTIHPPGKTPDSQQDRTYPPSRWGLDILDIIEEEELPPERVIIGHMDRTLYADVEYQKKIADRGAFVEYDLWGHENYYQKWDDGLPSDNQRVDAVAELLEEGYNSRVLFSQDIAQKITLTKYGGFGYAHILRNIIPRLKSNGITQEQIDQIMVENPKDILTFASSDR